MHNNIFLNKHNLRWKTWKQICKCICSYSKFVCSCQCQYHQNCSAASKFIYTIDLYFNLDAADECLMWYADEKFSGCSDENAGDTLLMQVTWRICFHLKRKKYLIASPKYQMLKTKI